MTTLTIGGTQSGGTAKALTAAGSDAGGRPRFLLPEHTALAGRVIYFGARATPPSKDSLGVQEASYDIALTNIAAAEGCCGSTQQGGFYISTKLRWSLNQDPTLVDLGLDINQGIAFSAILDDLIKKGVVTA